jgi:hypothetical protein
MRATLFPPGMKLRGGQIIILLNFLVKLTNFLAIPPVAKTLGHASGSIWREVFSNRKHWVFGMGKHL